MHSDTKFRQELCYTTQEPQEARDFLASHEVTERMVFTESITHQYDADGKTFGITAEGDSLRFTQPAYLEFCKHLGIPERFALKITDELLLECVETMLGSENQKLRLLVRDTNVIAGVKRDNYVATKPGEFMGAAQQLFDNHLFREANISDQGTSIMFEPMRDQMIAPNVDNPNDKFNVGVAFKLGYKVGVVQAEPYSLRHVCTNVAVTASEASKNSLVEKLRRAGSSRYYSRLLENYNTDRYQEYVKELHNRLAKAMNEPLIDWTYDRTYKALNRLLGKEVAFALIGVTEDTHESIMLDLNYKKRKGASEEKPEDSTAISDMSLYEVFNNITAAAKGYSGLERTVLQELGGSLI